jgi:hypothetical protein
MGSNSPSPFDNTLANAKPLNEAALLDVLTQLRTNPALAIGFAIRMPPKRRPDEAHVKWDRTAWEVTFWVYHDNGTTQAFSRRAQDVPRFVPVAGRLALRWMWQVGGGLTARQIALCYAAAEATDNPTKPV